MSLRTWSPVLCALLLWGCKVHTTDLISAAPDTAAPRDAGRDAALRDAAARDAQTAVPDTGAAVPDAGPPTSCQGNMACACDNGLDDDGDGLVDGLDPECTGARDNDERTFATGADEPRSGCLDCFFDSNAGWGDDGCSYPEECLEGRPPKLGGDMACSTCTASAQCQQLCLPSTPNGCDCFGCCEIRRDDGSRVDVALTKECSLEDLDDPKKCPRCVPNPSCKNDCGQCELCPGQTEADLPEVCKGSGADAGPSYACDEGSQPCSAAAPCAEVYYCQQGCCLPILM
jgi:hypothetical protein